MARIFTVERSQTMQKLMKIGKVVCGARQNLLKKQNKLKHVQNVQQKDVQ
jgi:hypothetical protein